MNKTVEEAKGNGTYTELGLIRNAIIKYVRSRVSDKSAEYILFNLLDQFRNKCVEQSLTSQRQNLRKEIEKIRRKGVYLGEDLLSKADVLKVIDNN